MSTPGIPPFGDTWMITMECLAEAGGGRFLDGHTNSGTVRLSRSLDPTVSGARWAMTRTSELTVGLRCLGEVEGPRHLDGVTNEHRVRLAPTAAVPFSGARWEPIDQTDGSVAFKCRGHLEGSRYLTGRIADDTVALAPSLEAPFLGARWRVHRLGRIVTLESQGNDKEIKGRFLDGRPFDGSVALAAMAAGSFTGTHWLLQEIAGGVTLKCLAHTENQERGRFLDGVTPTGAVTLSAHTDSPFSGTHWELQLHENTHPNQEPGVKAFVRCLANAEGPRFLEGRVHDATVVLAGTAKPFTGTTWRILSPAIWYEPCPAFEPGSTEPDIDPALWLSTTRVGQLTGAPDPEGFALINPDTADLWGVPGVDLGANCEHEGKLYIFFGDVVRGDRPTGPEVDTDVVAITEDREVQTTPAGGIHLRAVKEGKFFDPFRVDGAIGLTKTFEVPSGAFSWAQQVFVFTHIWGNDNPARVEGCYLVSKFHPFGPGPFTERFRLSPRSLEERHRNDVFSGVAPVVVRNAEHRWLPPTDAEHGLVMFGIGYNPRADVDYSAIHLAWAPLVSPQGPSLDQIQYLDENGKWDPSPDKALAPFGALPNLQSISVDYLPALKQWIVVHMTSNAHNRMSGPIKAYIGTPPHHWPVAFDLFNPCREAAYGRYMHWPGLDRIHDNDPFREPDHPLPEAPAWAYGAFLLNRFTRWNENTRELDLVYLLSLSSPYQVQLMRTRVKLRDFSIVAVARKWLARAVELAAGAQTRKAVVAGQAAARVLRGGVVAADEDPRYRVLFAEALHSLTMRFFAVQQPGEAVSTAREAVAAYRRAAESPGADIPALAGEMVTLSHELSVRQQPHAAVAPAHAAVDLLRPGASSADADARRRGSFAGALYVLVRRLLDDGRANEALAPAEEAVSAYRRAATVTGADIPALAGELVTLSLALSLNQQPHAALAPVQGAVDLLRPSASSAGADAARRGSFASALHILASRLVEVHRRGEALVAAQEARRVYQRLAQEDPATFQPELESIEQLIASLRLP